MFGGVSFGPLFGDSWRKDLATDVTGKTILVTGGNSGIGLAAAKEFARRGAHVVIGCRNPQKATAALDEIRAEVPGAHVESMSIDLASLASVRRFVEEWKERGLSLDILVNNAGVMALPFGLTEDGYERQFATNHLGHFALTAGLLPIIEKSPIGRVVVISSIAQYFGKMRFDSINDEKTYSPQGAYSQSKLANTLFAFELDRRLKAKGSHVKCVMAHPGYAATNIQISGPQEEGNKFKVFIMKLGNDLIGNPPEYGCRPTIRAALDSTLKGGEFIGPRGLLTLYGQPGILLAGPQAYNREDARTLWEVSEEMANTPFVV